MNRDSLRILVSAAEASSDAHGAELLKALGRLSDRRIEAFGIGGPKLQASGFRTVVDARELLVMGFSEIISRLPKALSALRRISDEVLRVRPDVAVLIDYPEFHLRLAKILRRRGIPTVCYIPPKLWVWRSGRLSKLRALYSKVLCVFPFEKEFYEKRNFNTVYVGNPLLDELPLGLTREQARSRLSLDASDKVLVLMPGSRPAEIKRHLPVMLDAAMTASKKLKAMGALGVTEKLYILVPLSMVSDSGPVSGMIDRLLSENVDLSVKVGLGNAHESLVAADAGIIKSGTSTLEAALLGCPHILVYKISLVSEWIVRNIVKYDGPVGLVNLLSGGGKRGGPNLVKELLCADASSENISAEIVSLFTDQAYKTRLTEGFKNLHQSLMAPGDRRSPSEFAACEVLSAAAGMDGYI
ncbi:MAG: lipid-A-disaccharide synthase [Bdellovibrionota bacterium]